MTTQDRLSRKIEETDRKRRKAMRLLWIVLLICAIRWDWVGFTTVTPWHESPSKHAIDSYYDVIKPEGARPLWIKGTGKER